MVLFSFEHELHELNEFIRNYDRDINRTIDGGPGGHHRADPQNQEDGMVATRERQAVES